MLSVRNVSRVVQVCLDAYGYWVSHARVHYFNLVSSVTCCVPSGHCVSECVSLVEVGKYHDGILQEYPWYESRLGSFTMISTSIS